jgi:hypothetical protein
MCWPRQFISGEEILTHFYTSISRGTKLEARLEGLLRPLGGHDDQHIRPLNALGEGGVSMLHASDAK